jgi:non-ribosomal peptide synthetase component E (peptide arylation enzyme)
MERLAYRELAENLSKIDAWLTDIGLNRYDRIRIHQRNVMELAEAVDSGKGNARIR